MARVRALAGRPIAQYSSPNVGGRMSEHRGIVLHIAEGYFQGSIAWQMNGDQRYADGTRVTTSSTWIVGREPGEWAQMVDSGTIAWTQRDGSRTWLSIELVGFTRGHSLNPGGWEKLTAWQIEACAQLLAWCHRQHGIPLQVASSPSGRGLGHHSMGAPAWGHNRCPGSDIIAAKGRIVARAKEIVEGDRVSAKELWGYRIPPEAGVKDEYPGIREDGYRAGTWLQYAYRWARRNNAKLDERADDLVSGQAAILSGIATILAKMDGVDVDVQQLLRSELERHRQHVAQDRAEALAGLAELVRQRDAGELTAEQVVDEIARRLSGDSDSDEE